MVRQRDKAGTYGGLSTIVRNGKTRLVKNKSRKSLSADGSESGRNPCRARETQRQNHFRVRRVRYAPPNTSMKLGRSFQATIARMRAANITEAKNNLSKL